MYHSSYIAQSSNGPGFGNFKPDFQDLEGDVNCLPKQGITSLWDSNFARCFWWFLHRSHLQRHLHSRTPKKFQTASKLREPSKITKWYNQSFFLNLEIGLSTFPRHCVIHDHVFTPILLFFSPKLSFQSTHWPAKSWGRGLCGGDCAMPGFQIGALVLKMSKPSTLQAMAIQKKKRLSTTTSCMVVL